ncbi:MAG: hypothetical protein H6834_08540 [Planctomycetes bacterium]|nr:hypothetical protein [Planctomycetota bacterium]
MRRDGLIERHKAIELFESIVPALVRYPAIDPESFRSAVLAMFASGRA